MTVNVTNSYRPMPHIFPPLFSYKVPQKWPRVLNSMMLDKDDRIVLSLKL